MLFFRFSQLLYIIDSLSVKNTIMLTEYCHSRTSAVEPMTN
uniref:Uncharacterized protein n=1 Tax=Ciona intestinalis TaxID=7719 RepID=H2XU82_CIOIN